MIKAFQAAKDCFPSLEKLDEIPENIGVALKKINEINDGSNNLDEREFADNIARQLVSTLKPLQELVVEKEELLPNFEIHSVIGWAATFLSEFERSCAQPDHATKLLMEFKRLSPAQQNYLVSFVKKVAKGDIQVPDCREE